ncbi:Mavicyanin [Morella rubra]|uniref:Mavicyanin n=1 Tax=Morella rubra TaxID=262757 RepID=A0A6A1VLB4_9ROSI|nr:Mavicyanin [Morella rubra]
MASLATSTVISMCCVGVCFAAVYTVGDSEGWTSNGKVDYKSWVSRKTFFVGDAFVTREEFKSCNLGILAPITYYWSGRDNITMRKPGHYYYICSFPDRCQAGQKVDIRVLQSPSRAPSPSELIGVRLLRICRPRHHASSWFLASQ